MSYVTAPLSPGVRCFECPATNFMTDAVRRPSSTTTASNVHLVSAGLDLPPRADVVKIDRHAIANSETTISQCPPLGHLRIAALADESTAEY